jgi:MerR family transcriptional regulator, mercuric resistance operon regulatory protein
MPPITEMRAPPLSIGELSRLTGVHIETIRYYERVKMLPTPPRTSGGRRTYGANHRRTLGFIRRARNLGFNLDAIRALLDLDGLGRASCGEVQEIAGHHLASVRAKLADLMRLEAVLSEMVGKCTVNVTPTCPMLDSLGGERGTRAKKR